MSGLTNKRIVLGVSGSIAAYKAPDIVRRLQDLGADVRVIVTDGGREFVSERSLQTISKNKVHNNLWDCLLYTSPSPRDGLLSRMPSSA